MTYDGLPRSVPQFLRDLAAHNDRSWFEANRDRYQSNWLEPGLDLIAALSPLVARMQPPLQAVPRLNASLRRIHRDVRFSADKRPYQPWLHLILSTGPEFNKAPGFHLVLHPDGIGWGAGHYGLSPAALDRFRHRVTDPAQRAPLLAAIRQAETSGARLDAPDLARLPKGWTGEADWDHLLRRKSLILRTAAPMPFPDWLFTEQAPRQIAQLAAAHGPLLSWLIG